VIRAVFDTGVVVSALLFRSGPVTRLRAHWSSRAAEALVCRETVDELLRVLAYPKFALAEAEIEALLAEYLPWTRAIRLPAKPAARLPRCRDPHDQIFLELASAGEAAVLVTGDRHLLDLAGRVPFAIEEVAVFLARLRPEP
jgi:putative PIN family toxin of toxin-antitoxin system